MPAAQATTPRVFAFEEALRLYESALESARDDSTRAHLLERMAQVSQMQGRLQEARVSLEEAVALHRTRGDKLAVGRVLTALSNVLWRIGDLKQVEMLADALAVLETEPPGPELVVAYSELAGHRAGEAAYAAAIEAADRALDLATELSLPEPARALGYRGEARASLGGREGIDDMRRALVLAAEQGQDRAAAVLHNNVAEALWIYDGPQAALEACRDGVEFCRDRGIDEWVRFIASTRLPLLVWCGRPAQALAEAEPLAEQADAAGDLTVLTEARSIQIHLAAQRGTGSEQLEAVELLLAHAPRRDHLYVVGVAAAAQLLVSLNRIEPAGALLAELEQVADLHDEPRYVATLPDVVRCALAIGDRDLAARFVIGVHARMPLFAHALCSASASLAEADTDLERAADLYAEAAERWRAFGNVPELAHALLGRGRCVLALERADADKPLTEAAELFKTLGYELPLATVDALLAYGAIGS
jgi:tetratricopeptide (TPR) repeat protein